MDNLKASAKSVWDYLDGKKTYIVGAVMIIYAGIGFWGGQLTSAQAKELVLEALAFLGLRYAIK